MKKLCTILLIMAFILSGCRTIDPFETSDFELLSTETNAVKEIEKELTQSQNAVIFGEMELIHFTNTVVRGNKAELVLIGKPNTEYTIRVTYHSGISKSKSLSPQISDHNGIINWSWTVGASTKVGTYPVEVALDGETVLRTELNVI